MNERVFADDYSKGFLAGAAVPNVREYYDFRFLVVLIIEFSKIGILLTGRDENE